MSIPDGGPEIHVELRVCVPRVLGDAVCSFVIDNISPGLEIQDQHDSPRITILFWVPQDQHLRYVDLLHEYLRNLVGPDMPDVPRIDMRPISNTDWEQQYRRSVPTMVIDGDIVVRPPWDSGPHDAQYDIVLEPKMAFGTGRHETTRSCLRIIKQRFRKGTRFLDVGCGSGILSILADKLGAAFIKAVDVDPVAVANCRENFAVNGVTTPYEIREGSLETCHGDSPYDFVCANIIKATILDMLPGIEPLTTPFGLLVLSGLLADDEPLVRSRLALHGFSRVEARPENEWVTLVAVKE